jgi:hypothetical protein
VKADVSVSGLKELILEFSTLTKDQRKVAKIALQSAMKVIAAEMANQLDPRVNELGKSVGYRIAIYRGQVTKAKVGFNVGKGAKKRRSIKGRRSSKGGVGIGSQNLHWFILGTDARYTGKLKHRGKFKESEDGSGRRHKIKTTGRIMLRGRMKGQQPGLAGSAYNAVKGEARQAAENAAKKYLEAQARRIRKKQQQATKG